MENRVLRESTFYNPSEEVQIGKIEFYFTLIITKLSRVYFPSPLTPVPSSKFTSQDWWCYIDSKGRSDIKCIQSGRKKVPFSKIKQEYEYSMDTEGSLS